MTLHRAHHDELTAVVQPVSDYVPEGGCLITAADALQQRVSELLEQVRLALFAYRLVLPGHNESKTAPRWQS